MDISPIKVLSLFSGAGGLELGAKLASPRFKTVCYVEYERYAQAVLMSRIREGKLDDAPIWDDVRTFDGRRWSGRVDIISGGFPCQDVSIAGKQAGIKEGNRSGLWKEFARIIHEVRPRFVLVENVPGLIMGGGIADVLRDLAQCGFNAKWEMLSAGEVGANHLRKRIWILCYSDGLGWISLDENKKNRHSNFHCEVPSQWKYRQNDVQIPVALPINYPSSGILRNDDGLAEGVDRIRLCGNGVVPQQSVIPWKEILNIYECGTP